MTICESIFQKSLYELTLQDLESFFSIEQEETSVLEFKEGGTDLQKLYKEIAAFLNTEGGLLIYGAPREKENPLKKDYKVAQGSLTPSVVRDRDVIMRSLGSNISPAPAGIKIQAFEVPGGSVYVLEIPQSLTPPHQVSSTGVYYLRLERESKPAPHGLVEALFYKRQKPNLQVEVSYTEWTGIPDRCKASVKLTNASLVSAENPGFIFMIDGVEEIFGKENLFSDDISEESYTFDHQEVGSIFVKGLAKTYSLTFCPVYSVAVLRFIYYCKNAEAKVVEMVIDHISKKTLTYGNLTDEMLASQDLIKDFSDRKKADFLKILNREKSQLNAPVTSEQFSEASIRLGLELPRGYLDFIDFSNGFEGSVGRKKVKILDIASLCEARNIGFRGEKQILVPEDRLLKVAEVDSNKLYACYRHDKVIFYICIYNAFSQGRPAIDYLPTVYIAGISFFRALKVLLDDE